MCGVGNQFIRMAHALPVQLLVDALVAATHQVRPFDLHHVPVDIAGVGHDLDPCHFAVVLTLDQLAAILGTERFEDRLVLGFLAGPTIADHDHLWCRLGTAQAHGQQRCAKAAYTWEYLHRSCLLPVPEGPVFLLL